MLNWFRDFCLWNRAQRREDEAHIRVALKASWAWALPMWFFPAVVATDWIANGLTQRQLVVRGLLPFGLLFALAAFGTRRIEMGRKPIGVIFYLIPFSVFLLSAIAWAFVHDFYVR